MRSRISGRFLGCIKWYESITGYTTTVSLLGIVGLVVIKPQQLQLPIKDHCGQLAVSDLSPVGARWLHRLCVFRTWW